MRVLLDECLPKKLKREVEADEVKTVPEVGWAIKRMETFCDAQGLSLVKSTSDPGRYPSQVRRSRVSRKSQV
jgi:hypothetical protein